MTAPTNEELAERLNEAADEMATFADDGAYKVTSELLRAAAARLSESGGAVPATGMHDALSSSTTTEPSSVPPTLSALVERQANDPALWFVAQTAPEAYLQKALRELHRAIEESPADLSEEAREVVALLRAGCQVPMSVRDAMEERAAALIERLSQRNERYLNAIFAMADDGWLMHGEEGMDDVQKAVYEIAQEHPEYKRRAALKERT